MLLDEPTNHLDLETMIWLENWIRQSDAAVMLVSHERKFMDALATRVFEIHEGRFSIYKGNYTEYLRLREERWGQWAREYENQQQEIAQLQRFIDRFRYNASKAALVQSRVKALERIERIPPPPRATPSIHFRFPSPDRGNKEVIQTRGLRKSFGSNHVLEGIDFDLYRGEKVALVGLNGAGKTTLLKILAGNLAADGGEIQQGVTVKPAYFAQYDYDGVTEGNSVWSEMSSVTPPGLQAEARRLLGGFFFIGDDVDKPVAVLSGGEKTRLRLAKMLFSGANLLLLDEPTNHLDIASRATLERAMRDYEGTVLFVSHDRAFIDAVATRVVEIKDGALRSFPGNYSDYCHALLTLGETSPLVEFGANGGGGRRARPTVERKEANGKSRERGRGEKPKPKNEERQAQRAEFKQASREKKRVQKLVEELEREIARVERRIGEIDAELAQPAVYRDHTRVAPLAREKEKIEVERAAYMQQWEVQAAKLEKL
jgi:ATP-binding cassette subfamily F protein 3